MNTQPTLAELAQSEAIDVSGGKIPFPIPGEPIKPITPPVYFTLALGEGGGDLPDNLA